MTPQPAQPVLSPAPAPNRALFISGGIGDVIALTCFLDIPSEIEAIYYATRKRPELEGYMTAITGGRPLRHISLWDQWSDCRWGFYSLDQFLHESGRTDLSGVIDWSIKAVFEKPLIFAGLPWTIGHPLSSIHELVLPTRYAVLAPYSSDKRDPHRDFTSAEFNAALAAARAADLPLVLLNKGDDPAMIEADGLINLQNRTNLLGSIDVTLGASLYIGVDSALSVVASKVLPAERLLIKSHNLHCRRWQHIYFAPHTKFDFVTDDIGRRLRELEWGFRG